MAEAEEKKWWEKMLDVADRGVDIYGDWENIKNPETVPPTPTVENNPPPESTGFQGFGEMGLQSSLGVVGMIAFIYFLAVK